MPVRGNFIEELHASIAKIHLANDIRSERSMEPLKGFQTLAVVGVLPTFLRKFFIVLDRMEQKLEEMVQAIQEQANNHELSIDVKGELLQNLKLLKTELDCAQDLFWAEVYRNFPALLIDDGSRRIMGVDREWQLVTLARWEDDVDFDEVFPGDSDSQLD